MSLTIDRIFGGQSRQEEEAPPGFSLQAGLFPATSGELIVRSLHAILGGVSLTLVGRAGRISERPWGSPLQQAGGFLFLLGAIGFTVGSIASLYTFLQEKWHLDGKRVLRTAFTPTANLLFLETRRPSQVFEAISGKTENLLATATVQKGDWVLFRSPFPGATGAFFQSPANFVVGNFRGLGFGTNGSTPTPFAFLQPVLTFPRGSSTPIHFLPPRWGLLQILGGLLDKDPPAAITVMRMTGSEWEFSRIPFQRLAPERLKELQWGLSYPFGHSMRNGLLLGAIAGIVACYLEPKSTPRDYWTHLFSGGISGAVGSLLMMSGYTGGLVGKVFFFLAATSAGYWLDRSVEQISKGEFYLPF